ncbi:coiled-coil domain-containing protein 122 [Xyrichtys novacula]|uniref:Coiled-coil domain-containing protein 122 n=1 Tax=Xyrichtys novacula TaxID=13765 RepID=A0AAV1HNL9_XYRNO|nr:coiled-coil domain-containing protein 122 [Xyrichtys novacula]
MSNFEDGTEKTPEFSLTKAVEDVCQGGYTQTVALEENQKTLSSLQSALQDINTEVKYAEQDLRAKVRDTLLLECEIEHQKQQNKTLHDRCVPSSNDNSNLQMDIREEVEKARRAQELYSAYRKKMEGHRAAVRHAESQTEAHKELEEKREVVRTLMKKKEELRADLENPNGITVQMAQREINALYEEISAMKKTAEEKRKKLHQELELHSQIEKEIEIQNKRFEAIVKRLHCQMSRAQAVQRQLSTDIYHLERQLDELKRQLQSSQDSAVCDY